MSKNLMSETEFKKLVKQKLNRPNSPFRVWTQNAGSVPTFGGWYAGAPEGSADLTGICKTSGKRIEIEVKVDHRWTEAQQKWKRSIESWGGYYRLLRMTKEGFLIDEEKLFKTLEEAIDVIEKEIK